MDKNKTKEQLINELAEARKLISELEASRAIAMDERTSELKAAIIKSEEARAISEAIIAAIGDGISIRDTDYRLIYQNQVLKNLLGDHVGEYCYKAFHNIDQTCDGCPVDLSFKVGEINTTEKRVLTDKGIIYVENTASPIRDSTGKIIAGIEVVRDVTIRKNTEEELRKSNERLNAVLEASPAAIITMDSDGIVTLWNKSAERIFGWSLEEAVGRFYPIVPEDKREEFRSLREKVFNGETIVGVEVRRQKKDDSPVDINISCAPLLSFEGKIDGILAVVTDITERKKAEQAIRLAHTELKQIFNTSVDGMAVIDKDCNLLRVNETFLSLLGWNRNEIAGKKCHEIFSSPPLCHTENCPVARILSGEESVEFETEKTRKDGVNIPCIVTATPFKNPEGEIIGIVENIRDITEHKKMEENILKIRKLESIGILAGGIAHDFNNLLQVILGYIGLAKIGVSPEEEIHYALEEAEKASNQARDLSYRLLTFAKGGEPLKKLTAIKTLLSESVSYALSYTNISCEFSVPEDLYPVEIDPGQIRQVIQNLLFNAQEAMPEGGTINVCARNLVVSGKNGLQLTEGRYVEISIKDHGVGIPEEILPRIFDPYFTTKDMGSQKGGGLGLAICYSIIKKHGGVITVKSKVGSGTTFYVYLPASEMQSSK